MDGNAFAQVAAKFMADRAVPDAIKRKIEAGYLPCRGVWLKQADYRACARRLTWRRYIVTLELLVLLAAIAGCGALIWALLRLLCCS